MLGQGSPRFPKLFVGNLSRDVRQEREGNAFEIELLILKKLLAREVYRHILLEPTCCYQVSVQATEIQLKSLASYTEQP
ncbi:MAG TPA: hypothetical protein PKY84_07310 [Thermosynergistes sp.]|nr:hypothetical protein [Thermosynergistes sp.]